MPEVKTFFRYCPSCGRRFHIKLVSKKLVDSHRDTYEQKRYVGRPNVSGGVMSNSRILEENVLVSVDVEDLQYSYKCSHCGHRWTEERVEKHRVG
jgi:DNA-directed RNA polymerase subunit RPC12/RpoP